MGSSLSLGLGIAGVVLSGAALALSALALRRSIPRRIADRLDQVESEAARWRAACAALVEEAEGVFRAVERKRASVAASAARLETVSRERAPSEEGSPVPSRAQLRLFRRGGAA